MTTKEAQSEAPSVETLEEILEYFHNMVLNIGNPINQDAHIELGEEVLAKINRLITEARIDENNIWLQGLLTASKENPAWLVKKMEPLKKGYENRIKTLSNNLSKGDGE